VHWETVQFLDDLFELAVFLRLARLSPVKSRIIFFAPKPTFHRLTYISASKAVRVVAETVSEEGWVVPGGEA
jgi:hypothetical protein